MPCLPFKDHGGRTGFLCVPNEPIEIRHDGKLCLFEWTDASGWIRVDEDGIQLLSPAPKSVHDKLDKIPRPE